MGLLELSQRHAVIKLAKELMNEGINPLQAILTAELKIESKEKSHEEVTRNTKASRYGNNE